jgi:PIN domain nuclease of toxin-antitoxin system
VILLDTHVLLWLVAGSPRLGTRARGQIQSAWAQGEVAVSSFTFWEIALLHASGRLDLDVAPRALRRRLAADGLQTVPVDAEIAFRSVELGAEGFHADPADRIIAATAIVGGYRLSTADRRTTAWAHKSSAVTVLDPTR